MVPAGKYRIILFEEYIQIALTADRIVGIYPECKNPVHINAHVSSHHWPFT
jgi:glycerophosphoryl diester phosphodiesterase